MPLLDQFNHNVASLESEVKSLADIREAFQKIAALAAEYDSIHRRLDESIESISASKDMISEEKDAAIAKLAELKTQAIEQEKKIDEKLNSIDELLNKKADEISDANRKFYNDFAATVQTRLDNNKMEIKHLIDEDSQSTRQQLCAAEASLNQKMEERVGVLATKLDNLRKIVLGMSIFTLVLLIGIIVLLFVR